MFSMQWYKQTLFFLRRSCCWEISTGLAQVQQLRFRFLGRHWKVVLQPAKKQNTAKVQMISLRTLVKFGWDSVVNARCISSSFSLAFFFFSFFFLDGDDGEPRRPFRRSICRAGESRSGRCRAGPSAPEQRSHGQQPGPVQRGQEEPAHARNGCHGRGQIQTN